MVKLVDTIVDEDEVVRELPNGSGIIDHMPAPVAPCVDLLAWVRFPESA